MASSNPIFSKLSEPLPVLDTRRMLIHALTGPLSAELDAVADTLPVEQYVCVDWDGLRREIANAVVEVRLERCRAHVHLKRSRDAAVAAILSNVFDAPVYVSKSVYEIRGDITDASEPMRYTGARDDIYSEFETFFALSLRIGIRVGDRQAPLVGMAYDVEINQTANFCGDNAVTFTTNVIKDQAFECVSEEYTTKFYAGPGPQCEEFFRNVLCDIVRALGVSDNVLAHINPPVRPTSRHLPQPQ